MKSILLFLLVLALSGSELAANGPPSAMMPERLFSKEALALPSRDVIKDDGWHLVWNDEFHSEKSLIKWNPQNWPSKKNGEWQYYLPENIDVQDGSLVISSRKESFKGRSYTSGAVTTEDKFEFTYGKIEIRAKLPKGQGVFPALWLVNSEEYWLPEINIVESIGQEPNELYFVVHWRDEKGELKRDYKKLAGATDFAEDFHLYGLIWEPGRIVWTLDGKNMFETKKYSPDIPLFLYLNTAIGGTWPGPPDPRDSFPKELLIDYVRVYQQGGEGQ
ncbi:glycoside hydrolase family 16 protein [Bacillus infantis]|uniref:glycoside hydrolase family 16 protein n=1 Tax=Bacillus infantis TaxID=324767 RepID=UPI000B9BF590|nr:glycoside hydrolase family 16 protein [Bacillus infantis]MCK6206110.1 glycoside hydrolase family 16 protein [Bacillus infantis]OXT16810.1 laminarinase [Bacillus sp. OG2]